MPQSPPDPLLTVRAAVILLWRHRRRVRWSTGHLAHRSFPDAVLAGGSAMGGATLLFNSVIGR